MLTTIHLLNFTLPVLYLLTFGIYTYDFFNEQSNFIHAKRAFLFITLIIHTIYLFTRSIEFEHAPITNKYEIFTLLAFAICFSYFLLELLTDVRGTGLFIVLFALIFQIISTILIQDLVEVKEVLKDRSLGLHVVSAIMGYSGFTISAVYGILFLLLYKNLQTKKFGIFFKRLPSLETLENMSFKSLVIGDILLTFAMIIGIIWLPSAFPNFKYYDPKLVSTGLVWLVYTTGIIINLKGNWYGKRMISFSLTGFAIVILSLVLSNIFANSFHSFY